MMQNQGMKRLISCVAFSCISVVALSAHHSIATVYDGSQSVKIEGSVVEFQFINPHPLITVAVKDTGGNEQQWRLEMDNRSELAAVGFTSQTLQRGDRVIVSGSRSRTERNRLYIRRLDRSADGFWYEQVGGSPKTSLRSR
jgi:hypothetical protein